MDSRSSYHNDSNDSKIVEGDPRAAENVLLGYGVRPFTLACLSSPWLNRSMNVERLCMPRRGFFSNINLRVGCVLGSDLARANQCLPPVKATFSLNESVAGVIRAGSFCRTHLGCSGLLP